MIQLFHTYSTDLSIVKKKRISHFDCWLLEIFVVIIVVLVAIFIFLLFFCFGTRDILMYMPHAPDVSPQFAANWRRRFFVLDKKRGKLIFILKINLTTRAKTAKNTTMTTNIFTAFQALKAATIMICCCYNSSNNKLYKSNYANDAIHYIVVVTV